MSPSLTHDISVTESFLSSYCILNGYLPSFNVVCLVTSVEKLIKQQHTRFGTCVRLVDFHSAVFINK